MELFCAEKELKRWKNRKNTAILTEKSEKMRIKMRSRIHIFLFGVSEFHHCLGDIGVIECVTFRLFSFKK